MLGQFSAGIEDIAQRRRLGTLTLDRRRRCRGEKGGRRAVAGLRRLGASHRRCRDGGGWGLIRLRRLDAGFCCDKSSCDKRYDQKPDPYRAAGLWPGRDQICDLRCM
jgi:hypothetical protein